RYFKTSKNTLNMKNLIIVLLFLPAFVSAQYGIKNCHTDLVFGVDYGDRIDFQNDRSIDHSVSSLKTLRIGANVNYQIADRWILVSGFRVSSRFSHEDFKIWGINQEDIPTDYLRVKSQDIFAGVPFRFRFILKNINRENRLYMGAGTQFNFYVFSHWKEEYKDSIFSSIAEEKIERTNGFRDMHLTSNFSFGWESEVRNGPTFFIQTIGRIELIPADYSYNKNAYHVGIETGLRF
ncbi:MAG: hypothetical protein AB8F94_06665, partial [Saprospiraceae bacterium]